MENKDIFPKYINIFSSELLPTSETKRKGKNITFDEVKYLVDNLEEFISVAAVSFTISQIITCLTELIVAFGLVDKFEGEDQDFCPADFPHTANNAEKSAKLLKVLIKEFNQLEKSHKHQFLINILFLCATHYKSYHWSNERSIKGSKELLTELLECTQQPNLSCLLCDSTLHPTLFKGVLKKIRPSLMKDTWMQNPSSCHIFLWFLTHVKHPYLEDYLPDIFPPPFMFVSYFAEPQRVIGIQCFDHILDNVPPTLMRLDGKQEAIYHSLYSLTYAKELNIIKVLYPCILKLPMMSPQKQQIVYWDKFDELFHQLLFNVEFECNPQVKDTFLKHVLAFIKITPPFKHLKRIMNILKRTIDENIFSLTSFQITALSILKSVIVSCWPRMEHHCFSIIVFIVELLEVQDEQEAGEIRLLCEECIILLKRACSEKFESLTSSYIEDCPNLPGVEFLKSVINKEEACL